MRTKIISALLGAVLTLAVAIPALTHKPAARTYPALLRVTAVQGLGHDDASDLEAGFLVCLRNEHGFIYRIHTGCGDYNIDEYYCCTMDDNGTAKIIDDVVLDMRYVRVDLFE